MTAATTANETPVYIPSGDEHIFGVLTTPTTEANGAAILLLFGGLYAFSIARNRVAVTAARRFASLGYHVLRLDLHGVGESSGVVETYDIAKPFFADVLAAARWLETQEIDKLVLVGHCYGARTCLAASEQLPQLGGVALFSMPILKFRQDLLEVRSAKAPMKRLIKGAMSWTVLRKLISGRDREKYLGIARAKIATMKGHRAETVGAKVSPDVVRQLRALADSGTPVLLVYGDEEFRDEFAEVRPVSLDDIIGRPGSRIDVRLVDHLRIHGFPSLEAQTLGTDIAADWLAGLTGQQGAPSVSSMLDENTASPDLGSWQA